MDEGSHTLQVHLGTGRNTPFSVTIGATSSSLRSPPFSLQGVTALPSTVGAERRPSAGERRAPRPALPARTRSQAAALGRSRRNLPAGRCSPASPGASSSSTRPRRDFIRRPEVLGYAPSDLQSAYNLPSATNGTGRTVAVVDAYDDPEAEADLDVYRANYGLPACTTANGCFRKVNQSGGTSYPAANVTWASEISLDLDMVSAICPKCHILLVEATIPYSTDLGAAEDEAAALGATEISNSYGGPEGSFDTGNRPLLRPSGDRDHGRERRRRLWRQLSRGVAVCHRRGRDESPTVGQRQRLDRERLGQHR